MLTIAPPPEVAHQRRGGLCAQEGSGEIDGEHARPVLVSHVEDRLEDGDAGIVDQRVEPAELRGGDLEGARNAVCVGDVAMDGDGRAGLVERGKSRAADCRRRCRVAPRASRRRGSAWRWRARCRAPRRSPGRTWFCYPSFPPMPADCRLVPAFQCFAMDCRRGAMPMACLPAGQFCGRLKKTNKTGRTRHGHRPAGSGFCRRIARRHARRYRR